MVLIRPRCLKLLARKWMFVFRLALELFEKRPWFHSDTTANFKSPPAGSMRGIAMLRKKLLSCASSFEEIPRTIRQVPTKAASRRPKSLGP
jgi:hypothetical protein